MKNQMIRKGGALALGVGLVLLTGGCPLLQVDAEVPETCVTYRDVEIPATDGSGAISHSFVLDDLSGFQQFVDIDGSVQFVHVKLRATSGVSSLDFVDSAHVSVAAPGLPDASIVSCDGDCPAGQSELVLDTAAAVDALDYLSADSLTVTLDVAGDLPTTAWTMDVDVCVKASVSVSVEI